MMYEYMVLDDNTSIAHSELKVDGSVKIYIEKPIDGGFNHATYYLPSYKLEDNEGFSEDKLEELKKVIENNAHLIMEFAQKGGFSNASGF